MSDIEREEPPLFIRFSLAQLLFGTTLCGVVFAVYRDQGGEGLLFSVFFWPSAIIAFGLLWRTPSVIRFGVFLQALSLLLIAPAIICSPRFNSSRDACYSKLHELGTAIRSFRNDTRKFRPENQSDESGRDQLSWRVALLPYLDRRDLSEAFKKGADQPWDSPVNVVNQPLYQGYACRGQTRPTTPGETNYVALIGKLTAWGDEEPVKPEEITDGLSNTILIAESRDTGIAWSEPRDLNYDEMSMFVNDSKQPSISSNHGEDITYIDGSKKPKTRGAHVLMADGSVRYLNQNTDPEIVRSLILRNDGQ